MFTGIVAAIGAIERVEPLKVGARADASSDVPADAGLRLTVVAGVLGLDDVRIGDSIAIQGACMTVVAIDAAGFCVDVSRESLARTVGLDAPGPVNLEKAMRLSDRIGGHLVSGHVDGVGRIERFEPVGESWLLEIAAPAALARFLVYKGSITVDGVSLTVNQVQDGAACLFSVNLIPHTVAVTTLGRRAPGDRVNLEIDQVARYVDRVLAVGRPDPAG